MKAEKADLTPERSDRGITGVFCLKIFLSATLAPGVFGNKFKYRAEISKRQNFNSGP